MGSYLMEQGKGTLPFVFSKHGDWSMHMGDDRMHIYGRTASFEYKYELIDAAIEANNAEIVKLIQQYDNQDPTISLEQPQILHQTTHEVSVESGITTPNEQTKSIQRSP